MMPFEFHMPTRVVFGQGVVEKAGHEARALGDRCLLLTGRGSARRGGTLERVSRSLEGSGVEFALLEGIKSNPLLEKVHEGVDVARQKGVQFVVALGGGSVMDTAKAVAAGVMMEGGDVWDLFTGKAQVEAALPVLAIPTIAASGSEMNGHMVITNQDKGLKLATGSPSLYPRTALLDPALTNSVPRDYTAYGGIDAVCHLMEPYFNGPAQDPWIPDRLAEGLMSGIIEATDRALEDPCSPAARANLMWGASLALCGLTKAGVGEHRFPVHLLEHAVSALNDAPHGAGLAAILPGWLRWRCQVGGGGEKVAQFGRRVLGMKDPGENGCAAVDAFQSWLEGVGAPVDLSSLEIDQGDIPALVEHAWYQARIWGMDEEYNRGLIEELFSRCLYRGGR